MSNTLNTDIELLTCNEVAEFLRVKVGTVYSWISYKQIPENLYKKLGRKPIFIKENVISWFLSSEKLKPRHKKGGKNGKDTAV